jgi:hypothetical protein
MRREARLDAMSRASDLMARARAATGLEDFGEDSFREGLEILVASADAEGHLNDIGRMALDALVTDSLGWRLQIEDWYRRHPEIEEQEIVAPLIGLGLPRTGSTALSCYLAEDPAARSIRNWESISPCPPPETATEHTDPRIEKARLNLVRRHEMFPRMKQMLPSSATAPMECQTFMCYDFKSQLFQVSAQIPSYTEWLNHKADLIPTYLYVKRVLKLLQWRCGPKRWRLKNPAHSLFIDALDKVFPDARFWMTHRDVTSVIPSVTDLYTVLIKPLTSQFDAAYIAELNQNWCELGMRRMIAFREAGNEHRFFDVHFAPFQKDPYPILQHLYDWLGEELTPETRARMEAWRASTPREKHGSHQYDPAELGLDIAKLRERFRFYSDRFGVQQAA